MIILSLNEIKISIQYDCSHSVKTTYTHWIGWAKKTHMYLEYSADRRVTPLTFIALCLGKLHVKMKVILKDTK